MNPSLLHPFHKLKDRKRNLFQRLKQVDEEMLHLPESPGKWSVAQVIAHLMDIEESSLRYCQKKVLAGDKLPELNGLSFLRRYGFWIFLKGPTKIKTQPVFQNPTNDLKLDQLMEKWTVLEKQEEAFFENFPNQYLKKAIFRHPLMGRVRLQDMIRFFDGHIAHHEHQIKRILESLVR